MPGPESKLSCSVLAWESYRGALGPLNPTASPAVRTDDPATCTVYALKTPLYFWPCLHHVCTLQILPPSKGRAKPWQNLQVLLTWQASHVAGIRFGSKAVVGATWKFIFIFIFIFSFFFLERLLRSTVL